MEDIEVYSEYSSDEDNNITAYTNHQYEDILESNIVQQMMSSELLTSHNTFHS